MLAKTRNITIYEEVSKTDIILVPYNVSIRTSLFQELIEKPIIITDWGLGRSKVFILLYIHSVKDSCEMLFTGQK